MAFANRLNDRCDLMAYVDDPGPVFMNFADILNYPDPHLEETIERCCEHLEQDELVDIAAPLQEFQAFVQGRSLAQLEEIYTELFDTNPAYCLYVGYHLFGDSYERSVFLQELNQRFHSKGFSVDRELPDHLTVLLRFLAQNNNTLQAEELIRDAILPVLKKLTEQPEIIDKESISGRFRNSYSLVLIALDLLLQQLLPLQNRKQE